MCQLLGMNCNTPTDICFSFSGFQKRGGLTDIHKDGWGIAFFEGRGVRQFLDPQASAYSPLAELVKNYPIRSTSVISHIRKATQGRVALENTHPFQRELWGSYWIFAHNGNVPDFQPALQKTFMPVGDTDSERAFCWIMQEMKRRFGDVKPGTKELFAAIAEFSKEIGSSGEFNFLLSNGEALYAHCSTKLFYIVRKAPFTTATLKDREVTVDFSNETKVDDCVAVIATSPLTDNEVWTEMVPGTLWMFENGEPVAEAVTIAGKKTEASACSV